MALATFFTPPGGALKLVRYTQVCFPFFNVFFFERNEPPGRPNRRAQAMWGGPVRAIPVARLVLCVARR